MHLMKDIKSNSNKNISTSYSFISWKLIMSKSKRINLYFNYSNIQERDLLNHFTAKNSLHNDVSHLLKSLLYSNHSKDIVL